MPNIQINIKNKVARADRAIIVCDNSDYVAVFDFDDEWSAYDTKTARFVYGGRYTDVVFSGNECPVPVIQDTRAVTVGVFAGDLHTTTPAYISCVPSILCCNGIPADPTPDVYAQIMELLNKESGIWYPAVDDAGNVSWTRSMSETEPQPVNIKGQKGDAGADGADGKSAYELAQDNGFVGTMQEWLASLVGADGANGADGKDGISPAVSVAAITGGNRVTITDAEGAKTFDVMDGAQGASGADGKDYVLTDADKQEIAEAAAGFVDVPSVQPDWNQNNSTQPDYIKNRPFYMGDPVETVLVEESAVSFADAGGTGIYWAQFSSTFAATVGETYKVSWDGTAYECVCVDLNGNPAIGNLSISGAGSDTGEPFIMAVNNGVEIQIIAADTSASHTFSISGFVPEVVKIDKKYLPEIGLLKEINFGTTYADIVDIISAQSLPFIKLGDNYAYAILYLSGIRVNTNKDTFMFSSEPILDNSGRYVFFTTYVNENDEWGGIESNYMAKVDSNSKALYLNSSTLYSTKKFKITVDDSGEPTITNESDSTNAWKPTNLPTVTASDTGKFLRVSDTGEWVAETIPNASGVSF